MSYIGKFLDNKYSRWYFALVEKAKTRVLVGYVENHHILPASMGGERRKHNMVKLTAREHFVAHCLLVRCVAPEYVSKMWSAVWMFSRNPSTQIRYVNSRQINIARTKVADTIKKIHTGTKRPHRQETKNKLRIARAFQVISKESYAQQAKTMSSLVWMNDGVRSYRVNPNNVAEKIASGFLIGRLSNFIDVEYREKLRVAVTNYWNLTKRQACHI
jgi:hypothetical protein